MSIFLLYYRIVDSSIKQRMFEEFAHIGQALASPVRLELLDYLAQSECTVDRLAEKCGHKVGNTSQHLRVLARAGLVATRREGTFVYYRAAPTAGVLFDALGDAAASVLPAVRAAIQSYYEAPDQLVRRPARDLVAAVKNRDVILLDVRPPDEYAAGHIAGAINIPLAELKTRLKNLPKKQEIVAYCRGPFCVLAVEAVSALRAAGLRASRLSEGFPQWRARGWPSEASAQ
jgi:rhodanese-related sulfurtransferase